MSFRSIVKKVVPRGLFPAIEPYGHLGEAVLYNTLAGFPARGMQVIGVTGTNGKTTTCFMIHRMLTEAGYKVGMLTTVAYGIGDDIKPQMHHMTSVPVPELMQRLKAMRQAKVDYVVLETTSHALAQHRVWGVPYSVAVFTNLTHEHLAYHRTFERYRDAKRLLFKLTNRNKKGLRAGIINADDPNAEYFERDILHPITYGVEKGNIRAHEVKLTAGGVSYQTKIGDEEFTIQCRIPGSFNVSNSLAAVCVGYVLGLNREQIEQGISALEGVEGRMNRVDEGQAFEVIVDYAHTPDSFEKLFRDLRPVVTGKIIVLFGSLGGGDKGKRPLQGALAGRYADEVILTEEDDRQEDPKAILNEIAAGAEKAGKVRDKDLYLIHSRPEAIAFAFSLAKRGDTVLLLGKGHEKTIEHADGEHPWNESAEARKALKALGKKAKFSRG
jgi:UDP-N-acetylmuramoyl-L-alanyl-D-glutamate--2,6-diaminopimelate ligase